MTYYGLLEEAGKLLEKNKISYGEYVEMVKPLNEEIRKEGKWVPYKAYFGKSKDSWTDELKCSECGYEWGDEGYNFCPNCGARMTASEEEYNYQGAIEDTLYDEQYELTYNSEDGSM